ncbi:hypothetical protein [Wolbachia endosymbiont (group E) of Neria commutata]|uniref:hypothetical protein n=1 Tax=Wolbachia endosymbiont (group E) of Neria commutata TaxID=3066149 RepID=UPI003132FFA3
MFGTSKEKEVIKTNQDITATSTTEIDQVVVEDISVDMLMKTKLDLSHRLEHSLKTSLSRIRSSMTDTWYRIKAVVLKVNRKMKNTENNFHLF